MRNRIALEMQQYADPMACDRHNRRRYLAANRLKEDDWRCIIVCASQALMRAKMRMCRYPYPCKLVTVKAIGQDRCARQTQTIHRHAQS